MNFLLEENNNFTPFTIQHLLVLLVFTFFGTFLILWVKNKEEKIQNTIGNFLAFSICLTVIFGTILKFYKGNFDYQKDLPLHLCSFMAIIIPILSVTKKFLYYEIFLFLILAGTMQSLITPDETNFLNFQFFRYWFVHAGLVIFMMYATFVYKMRPTLKSVGKSFLAMQVYMLLMFVLNYFIGSNYFYTNRKPDAATLLDLFGDWPKYVFVVELIVIPYFLLIYLPFYLTRKKA
ncbi:TIGR02206 family membrane protein [Polaribacter aestuariivivens]|uniref:TIGR02206 family membrane protein n=1 Tax=Polaribacter aestuariivivens TaxID=2304626 RepID=A0A5S3NCL2_9FLAO|nr:TIGR02206 family membrane protein [Polaribacter aestuariivivens]TMM31429.1 TIGR02206 family membrane protein [Polaribacter aestuariivivens]